ncbi:MAG: DUF362 domain-containing protein [Desulfobulbaceae bacterium]|uniref:DUF362 domain-containing protein n=1 Tax=Candidatus Desulfatifera sulfidica TaxID=2841691 RepID=A0A8J6NBW6_9BACT|nr:DUF362 domain-containing protein [Candidatus Desulfatifera sulfidica]
MKIPVIIERCSSYKPDQLLPEVDRVLASLDWPVSLRGARIMLKPNLISARAPALACTRAEFVAAAAVWFLEHGCRVAVGDSPALGRARTVMEEHGILQALSGMDIDVVDFVTPRRCELARGVRVSVAAEALDCDLLVNLPKVKAHDQLYVTLAVKNLFGLVLGARKPWLHMRHGGTHACFAEILLSLVDLLPKQVVLADGVQVMTGHGPMWGTPFDLHCLAASVSPVALDTALLDLLELDPDRCPVHQAARRQGVPGSALQDLVFPRGAPAHFFGSGFEAPKRLVPVRFNPLRFMLGSLKRVVTTLKP